MDIKKIKSVRNVLATTTLASMLMLPANSTVFADETPVTTSSIEQTTTSNNLLEEVISPVGGEGSFVQKLVLGDNVELGQIADLQQAAKEIIQRAKAFDTEISFTYTGAISDLQGSLNAAINAELVKAGNDYVHGTISSWKYSYTSSGQVSMKLTYIATKEQEAYVTEQVKLIAASLVKPGMTDEEKVRAVNDYVVTNTVYSKTAKTSPHHVYAYLTEGKAVCQAYALLTYRLLTEMGFEARYVVGDAGGPHAWNSVLINGIWYHLDTTWNDASFNGLDTLTNTSYRYYLVTSETLRKDHTWEEADYPEATNNMYSYFHNVYMGIEKDGIIYYSHQDDKTLYALNSETSNNTQLLNQRAFFIAAFNEFVYFSNYSNGGYLTAFNINTKETFVIDAAVATQIRVENGELLYKVGSTLKKYELDLTEDQLKVRNVNNLIKAASPTKKSFITDFHAAATAYDALDKTLQAEVSGYQALAQLAQAIQPAEEVYLAIQNLNGKSIEAIQEARAMFEALPKALQAYVTNIKDLTTQETVIKNAVAAEKAIAAIDPSSTKFVAQVTAARKAYDKAGSQQDLVLNADTFFNLEKQALVFNVINALKATSANYIAEVNAAKAALDALGDATEFVTNVDKLTTAIDAIKPAQAVIAKINALDGTSATAIQDARNAYNALDATSKKYVTNLKTLTTKEAEVKNAIAAITAIDAIDPASSKFVAQVTAARKAYDKAGSQQDLVVNADAFFNLEKQALVFNAIYTLKATSANYIVEVNAAKAALDALGDATEFVTNVDKLTTALDAIKPAQAVIAKIDALDGTSATAVQEARNAYNALDATSKKYVTNLKTLTTKEAEVNNAIAAITAIDAIDPASAKFVAQVTAARKAYDKADSQQDLVVNADAFFNLEKQALVFNAINALKATNANYIAEVNAAKVALDALGDATEFVTNVDKLTTALDAIKPAQAVISTIDALDGSSIEAVQNARNAYNALDATSKKYVTNLNDLTAIEKAIAAPLKAIQAIEKTKTTEVSAAAFITNAVAMKKLYTALSDKDKALVTTVDDYEILIALYEIKNAQKTRKWATVSVETFKTIGIESVTEDNFELVTTKFNSLKAGVGTTTIEEMKQNITTFITQ